MHSNANPNSNPPPPDPYLSSHYSYYAQSPNSAQFSIPHLYSDSSTTQPNLPGVDSYPSLTSFPQLPQVPAFSYVQTDASGYYLDLNGLLRRLFSNMVPTPLGMEALLVSQHLKMGHNSCLLCSRGPLCGITAYQLQGIENLKKRQRKTKVVQSAYCEVCKVDCNSKEVLDQHKLVKKHKKNLEKLVAAYRRLINWANQAIFSSIQGHRIQLMVHN